MNHRHHRAMSQPISRSFPVAAAMNAIRQLETAGALTPAMANQARERARKAKEAML